MDAASDSVPASMAGLTVQIPNNLSNLETRMS